MISWKFVERVYVSQTENTGNSTFLEEIRGTHLSGKRNADVESLWEQGFKLTAILKNLVSFFQTS
jgi:hypothetical protein